MQLEEGADRVKCAGLKYDQLLVNKHSVSFFAIFQIHFKRLSTSEKLKK